MFDRAPTGEPIPPREYFRLEVARERRRERRRWMTAEEHEDLARRMERVNRELRALGLE